MTAYYWLRLLQFRRAVDSDVMEKFFKKEKCVYHAIALKKNFFNNNKK